MSKILFPSDSQLSSCWRNRYHTRHMNDSTQEQPKQSWWRRLSDGSEAHLEFARHGRGRPRHQAQARSRHARGHRGRAGARRSRHRRRRAHFGCGRRGSLRQGDFRRRGEGGGGERRSRGCCRRWRSRLRSTARESRSSFLSSASTAPARRQRSANWRRGFAPKVARSCWPRATRFAPRRSSS